LECEDKIDLGNLLNLELEEKNEGNKLLFVQNLNQNWGIYGTHNDKEKFL